jgi:hypothetical protein
MQKHTAQTIFAPIFAILSLLALAQSASADTISLMWDANPESQVSGYIVHIGTQPGVHSQHVDVGLTTAWSYASAVAGQQYCFTVSAYFAGPLEGPRSSEVCGFSSVTRLRRSSIRGHKVQRSGRRTVFSSPGAIPRAIR